MGNKINVKLGLKPAGKRRMMNLPRDLSARVRITAAVCPACGTRHATASYLQPGALWCTWCYATWTPE